MNSIVLSWRFGRRKKNNSLLTISMELDALIKTLQGAIESPDSLRLFVSQDMVRVLRSIAYVQYEETITKLESLEGSSYFEKANTTIRTMKAIYDDYRLRCKHNWTFWRFLRYVLDPTEEINAHLAACKTALLIAICYRAIGKEGEMRVYSKRAQECLDLYHKAYAIHLSDNEMFDAFIPLPAKVANQHEAPLINQKALLNDLCTRMIS